MVVTDFNFMRMLIIPRKADTPLLVNPYGVLTFSITFERFEPVAWRNTEIVKLMRSIQDTKFY